MTGAATETPPGVAYRIRDHLCALANALEAIRLSDGDGRALAGSLQLAGRQVEALAQLATELCDPARTEYQPDGPP